MSRLQRVCGAVNINTDLWSNGLGAGLQNLLSRFDSGRVLQVLVSSSVGSSRRLLISGSQVRVLPGQPKSSAYAYLGWGPGSSDYGGSVLVIGYDRAARGCDKRLSITAACGGVSPSHIRFFSSVGRAFA